MSKSNDRWHLFVVQREFTIAYVQFKTIDQISRMAEQTPVYQILVIFVQTQ
jgi:hypothetical protein